MARKSYLIILIYLLVQLSLCGYQDSIKQFDQLTSEKSGIAQNKTTQIQNLELQIALLQQLHQSASRDYLAALADYKTYINEKIRCDSLNPETDYAGNISTLPNNFCPFAPIQDQIYETVTLKYDIQNQLDLIQIAQKSVLEQLAFNSDLYDQLALYSKLREGAYIPLMAAVQKNRACLAQYVTVNNTDPAQCVSFKNQVSRTQAIYGFYRGREVTFGMSSRGSYYALDQKKGVLKNLQDALVRLNGTLNNKENVRIETYTQCINNLENLRGLLNSRLSAALQAKNNVSSEKAKANQYSGRLINFITQLKLKTNSMRTLVTSIKTSYR